MTILLLRSIAVLPAESSPISVVVSPLNGVPGRLVSREATAVDCAEPDVRNWTRRKASRQSSSECSLKGS